MKGKNKLFESFKKGLIKYREKYIDRYNDYRMNFEWKNTY